MQPDRLFFIAALFVTSLSLHATDASSSEPGPDPLGSLPLLEIRDDPEYAPNWSVTGPFLDLRESGQAMAAIEQSTVEQEFATASALAIRTLRAVGPLPNAFSVGGADADLMRLFALNYNTGQSAGAAYAATTLVSSDRRTVYLHLGSDDGLAVWLNGDRIYQASLDSPRPMRRFDDCVPLALVPGHNLLLLKIVNANGAWSFTTKISTSAFAGLGVALETSGDFLPAKLMRPGVAVKLSIRGAPPTTPASASVTSVDLSAPEAFSWPLDGLDPVGRLGVYEAAVQHADRTFRETFLIGEPDALRDMYLARLAPRPINARESDYISVLTARIDILLAAKQRLEGDRHWQNKIVHAIRSLCEAVNRAERGASLIEGVTGLRLGAFRSQIDDSLQCFQLFVPSTYERSRQLPLVVVLPTSIEKPAPFIASPLLADFATAELLATAAETHGLAILWPGYSAPPYGHPEEITHLNDAIEAMRKDYDIDLARMFLLGVCSSGMTSALAVVDAPHRYAAVGLVNPIFHRLKNRADDDGRDARWPAYRRWLEESSPNVYLQSLKETPFWIVQNGDDPSHGPAWHSRSLLEAFRTAGVTSKITYAEEITPYAASTPSVWIERFFPWFLEQRRQPSDVPPQPPTFRHGPVARILADRFLVVEPTRGTELELAAAIRIARQFKQAWQDRHFAPCRTIPDVQLTPAHEQESNLVIVGNSRTNAAWDRFAEGARFKIEPGGVSIDRSFFAGRDLAFAIGIEHPSIPGRAVLFAGATDLEAAAFGRLELSEDGWFDHAIWKRSGNRAELISAGRWEPLDVPNK